MSRAVPSTPADWLKMKNPAAPAVKREEEKTGANDLSYAHFASRVEPWGEKIGRPKEKGGQGSEV